jgi:hypothetical protein
MDKSILPNKPTIGERYNFLTVLTASFLHPELKRRVCNYQCVCGNITSQHHWNVKNGIVKSCGCKRVELIVASNLTHGLTRNKTRPSEYTAFYNAKDRCINPQNNHYHLYGARGIQFCFDSFEEFFAEVGKKPTPKHSLDRINNNGNYEKGNIRWATIDQQVNNRRNTKLITIGQITQTQNQWARQVSIKANTIMMRLRQGLCNECSVFAPTTPGIKTFCPHQ